MPQVLPVLGTIALNLAIGVAGSVLAQALRPAQKAPTQTVTTRAGFTFEMQVGEGVPVKAILGPGRASGALHYLNEYGEGDSYHLQQVIRCSVGEQAGLTNFLVDEKPVTLVGSNADAKGRSVAEYTVGGVPYLWVKAYMGAPGQEADPELVVRSNPSGRWTEESTMTGWAYLIVTIRYNADLFGSTLPRFGSTWGGMKLLDFRDPEATWGDASTYAATANPAVILWNWRRGIWINGVRVLGQGFSAFANDLDYFTAAANLCDELIEYPETDVELPRYAFGREVGDDEEKLSVVRELEAAMCGSSFKRGGAYAPLPAQQLISVMTLTNSDRMLGHTIRADRKGSRSMKKTMFHGQFISADSSYALAPFTPRVDTDLESLIGGRRAQTLDQPYEWLQERAQMRAEIALRRQMFAATRVETFTPKAFALEPGDAVTRVCEWGSMLMVVEKTDPLPDRTGVTITLSQWSNTIVPASGEEFVTLPTEPGPGPADPNRTIAVSGLGMAPYAREGGGAIHPFGRATWTPITDPNVDQVMIRVWPTAGTEADDKEDFFADSKLTSAKLVGPLQPLTNYTYKAIPIRRDGKATVWTNTGTFTTGEETTPAEIADGSITPEQLGQEMLNRVFAVVDQIIARQDDFEIQLGDLAQVVAEGETEKLEQVRGLMLRSASGAASVLQLEEVVLGPNGAFAQFTQTTNARLALLDANGYFRLTSEVTPETGTTLISFGVKATNGEWTSIAALELGAQVTIAGADSFMRAMADRFDFIATSGTYVATPFAIDTINGEAAAKVTTLYFDNLFSTAEAAPGVPIIVKIGETGFESITVPA